MKITKARLAEITKEIVQEEKEEYEKFFRAMLKKHGVSSPAELSDKEKKDFFNQVDAEYKAKHEGNAFGAAVTAAKAKGEDEFKVGGKTYQVESTDSINERYVRSMGFKETADRIERLSKTLDPKSILARNISKNADNVMPEFKKMKKYMDEIYTLWQEIEYTIEMSNESVNESAGCGCGCGGCNESLNEDFNSKDKTFEKVYSIFDKKDYFNAKGLAKVQIGNFERALQKKDRGAEQILNNFKGDMDKAKEYITQVISDRKKEQAFEDYKALKSAVDSIQKGKPEQGAVEYVKRIIHNNNQKYSMALYSAIRNQKFTKWKDIHADVDSLIGESITENENPCWKGYKQIGMKDKNGKEVPNCVPESVETVFEGRAFVAAAKKAKEDGKSEFEFNGKTYPVTLKD
jgi:hypothetical protein